jgi:hypothetical protein
MMTRSAGQEIPESTRRDGRTVNRYTRQAQREFDAHDRFFEKLDKAREKAGPPRLRGRRLREKVERDFDETEATERAEQGARKLAVATLIALAKSYKRQERRKAEAPASPSLELPFFGESQQQDEDDDPIDVLLEAYQDRVDRYASYGPELLTALAQVGAAAVLQLGKEVKQPPKVVVQALLDKYFPDA